MSKIDEVPLEEGIRVARERALKQIDEMTEEEDATLTAAALADPDAQPIPEGAKFVTYEEVRRRPGRPRVPDPKTQITLRIDPVIIEYFKAAGPGWQSRINEALKDVVKKAS